MTDILLKQAQAIQQKRKAGDLTANEYWQKIVNFGNKNGLSFWEIEKALTEAATTN